MWAFLIFLAIFLLIDLNANTNITPFYIIICAILFAIYLIIHIKNRRKEKALMQSYIDDVTKAKLNKITSEVRENIINIFTIFGYMPTEERLNSIVANITTSLATKNDEEIFEKIISFIPKSIPKPNSLDYNLFVSINIDKIIKKYIPQKWQEEITIATSDYTNISEDELLNIVHRQKLMHTPNDIHLYRFNYAMFAYEVIYNCVQTIVIDDIDFTEEVRNIILQKILAGAEEEGYHLKDEYINDDNTYRSKQNSDNTDNVAEVVNAQIMSHMMEIYTAFGFFPSEQELKDITRDIIHWTTLGYSDEELFEKAISHVPCCTPSIEQFKTALSINIDKLIEIYIPSKWQEDIRKEAYEHCNVTEDYIQHIIDSQKVYYEPKDIKLFRLNYEYYAYEVLCITLLAIAPISKDFTIDTRNNIIQNVLDGANEKGYYLEENENNN